MTGWISGQKPGLSRRAPLRQQVQIEQRKECSLLTDPLSERTKIKAILFGEKKKLCSDVASEESGMGNS